jgi:hypothetical protein
MEMAIAKRFMKTSVAAFVAIMLVLSFAGCGKSKKVESGSTWEVTETTSLTGLTIADGAEIKAPEGYRVTMTVDGVETGQELKTWEGFDYKFAPGSYKGDIILTVAKANDIKSGGGGGMPGAGGGAGGARGASGGMPGGAEGAGAAPGGGVGMPEAAGGGAPGAGGGMPGTAEGAGAARGGMGARAAVVYPFRQALYLDANGIDWDKSVLAAVKGEKPTGFDISNIEIKSKGTLYKDATSPGGTGFNGIYAAGGVYNIKNVKIDFFGDGRSDFMGYGSAIVADGKGTKLIMDNVTINTQGVVRAGIIAKGGSEVIVKNSSIETRNGVLPPGYVATMDTSQMRSTLWISGQKGNARATSLMGTGNATYINSSISSEGWGALSTDGTSGAYLNAVNSKVIITGDEGYGNYNDPDAHVSYYGCEFDIATFASCIGSGDVYYGDSTTEVVRGLNEKFNLGLTDEEIKSIPAKSTIINSRKYGVMWHRSGNPLTIDGGTTINTAKTTFYVAGVPAVINMNGSGGAQINSGTGVIMQVASDDQPPDMSSAGYYEEPATGPASIKGFDNTSVDGAATANFSNIKLKGDFYNSAGWGKLTDKLNMAVNLNKASIKGVISASESHHPSPKITVDNNTLFHSITDTVCPAVNNGVIVNLTNGSTWTVTGTSYITSLIIAEGSTVTAPEGSKVTMTVNGVKKEIKAGKYSGNITLAVAR